MHSMMSQSASSSAFSLQLTKLTDFPDAHVRVTNNVGRFSACKAFIWNISCGLHTFTNRLGQLAHFISAKLLIIHLWDFNMNINAVEQWT
jgi:hypothetical protein